MRTQYTKFYVPKIQMLHGDTADELRIAWEWDRGVNLGMRPASYRWGSMQLGNLL